ncbi:MAG: hypothetical protein ACXWU2_14365 [Allosphingosinicella sp.]
MVRVIIGSAVAAIAMFVIGFIFFGPLGLSNLASVNVDDTQSATVQQTLAANLPRTGTYFIPNAERSPAQTVMYGQGPIATIHYNTGGFAANDTTQLLGGLVFNYLVALLFGAGLLGIHRNVVDLGTRARVAVIIAVAATAYTHLGEPLYYHHDWPHFIYLFIADGVALAAAGIIVAWFLPVSRAAPAEAPVDV